MAGKVSEIQGILTPENLVGQLVAMYDRWRTQKFAVEQEWLELRNYLFATDTTTTSNSALPWKNKTTIPKLTQIRDNLHANYMDALFPNDGWIRWEGHAQDSITKEKRSTIESYMRNKIREGGFKDIISKCVSDYIDYGVAIGDVEWVNETHIDPLTGETITTYIGPRAIRVSPLDIVFNPTAADFKYSPKFTRYIKTLGELKKDLEDKPEMRFDQAALDKIFDTRKKLNNYRMEDVNKAQGYVADGFGSLSEYYQSGYVELLEFEGDIHNADTGELMEKRIITIVDRTTILRNIENPSWLGHDGKELVSWRDRPDNLYGMGPLANLVGMQYRVDHLENLKADAMDLTVQPPLVIVGDVDPFTYAPFEQIHVPEDGSVTSLAPNQAILAVNNEISYLLMLMEEMAGAPKEAMGIRSPGEKTAFEVQQLQNAAGRIFQHKVLKFEAFVERLVNTMLEVSRRNMDSADMIRVLDDDLGVISFMSITKEDITAKGKLRPIGARHYANRAQLMQNLNGVFSSPVGQMIAPHVSPKKLAHLIEDFMGFEQYEFIGDNVAIFEQQETQALMQEAQMQNDVASQIPAEEGMIGA
jgi:hypothetical protein